MFLTRTILLFFNLWLLHTFVTLGFLSKQFFFQVLLFFTAYWLINMFVYLTNISFFSKYTTSNQRFWRRASTLFWGIEFFIIGTYVYLILNSSVEPEWLASQRLLFTPVSINFSGVATTQLLFVLLFIILTFLQRTNNLFLVGLLLLISVKLLTEEFFQFFYYNNLFLESSNNFDLESMVWNWQLKVGAWPILDQYFYLLIFLKFWHALLVYFSFGVCSRLLLNTDVSSQNLMLRPHVFNLFMLWILVLATYVLVLKHTMQILYLNPFMWFQGLVTPQLNWIDFTSYLSSIFF